VGLKRGSSKRESEQREGIVRVRAESPIWTGEQESKLHQLNE